jgi:cytochrome c-type biogenesis protein CcmH
MKRTALLALAAFALSPASSFAQSGYNDVALPNPQQEAQAKALMETIRCVVCQGQSIADSNADLAADMRGMIRERIGKGESAESVRAWLIEHYGDWVSFKPTLKGSSAPLWLLPLLAFLIGAFLMRGRFKRKEG